MTRFSRKRLARRAVAGGTGKMLALSINHCQDAIAHSHEWIQAKKEGCDSREPQPFVRTT
jgi:hypothetical protein